MTLFGRLEYLHLSYPILSPGNLVSDLYLESQRTPLFRFEDVYVTGILAAKTKTKVHLVNDQNFDSKSREDVATRPISSTTASLQRK